MKAIRFAGVKFHYYGARRQLGKKEAVRLVVDRFEPLISTGALRYGFVLQTRRMLQNVVLQYSEMDPETLVRVLQWKLDWEVMRMNHENSAGGVAVLGGAGATNLP